MSARLRRIRVPAAGWQASRRVDHRGYVRVSTGVRGGDAYEHRLVAEAVLRRRLRRNEVVHHLNDDGQDNRPENLAVMARGAHIGMHNALDPKRAATVSATATWRRAGPRTVVLVLTYPAKGRKPLSIREFRMRLLGGTALPESSRDRIRTCDPVINSHLLYQLSYAGIDGVS